MHKNAFVCGCTACTAHTAWKSQQIANDTVGIESTLRAAIAADAVTADEDFDFVTPGETYYGSLTPAGDYDYLIVSMVAGETYSISLRGAGATPVGDTLLGLLDADGNLINIDDDGGADLNSLITYTAITSGDYYIYADSFSAGAGDYRIDVTAESSVPDVGDTFIDAATLMSGGLVFGFIDDSPGVVYLGLGEVDTFKVELVAGNYYTFQLAGGADYETSFLDVPVGELDTVLFLYDDEGNQIAFNDDLAFPSNISSGLAFLAMESGTYYLDVAAYEGQTGGYTLEVNELDVSDLDPLDSIRWESADNIEVSEGNIAYVYFAVEGENFGELADDDFSPLPSYGWNNFEKDQVMLALEQYSQITGITYMETADATEATFRLITTESEVYGAYMYPNDPGFGDAVGIGAFNILSGGWNLPGQQSLLRGGFSFGVVLHEFGHAHGLAHPHDTGGGSDVMLGVTGTSSLGFYNLNQGVYTVMSYNDAWQLHPDGPSPYTRSTVGQGWSGSLSAFDIAVLQERYGVHENAVGNDRYVLKDVNGIGTFYQTIWDTGGTDEIRYNGTLDAQIDLMAATLDYSPTGGGVVSFVDGIWGGFTIANGVVIENATGGSGNDVLMGNDANNVLNGRGGSDYIDGRGGDDRIFYDATDRTVLGGQGRDTLVVAESVIIDLGQFSSSQIAGKTVYGFENVDARDSSGPVVVYGSQYANVISGGSSADILLAGDGSDTVQGGGGADVIDGGAGRDMVHGGNGNDLITYDATDFTITGGAGNDTLKVSSAITIDVGQFSTTQVIGQSVFGFEHVDASSATEAVSLTGSQYRNTLIGGSGDDTITGGGAADALTGGAGMDRFVFGASAIGSGRATITDFAGDLIDLSAIDAIAGGADDAFTFIGTARFSGVAGQLRIGNTASGQVVQGDLDGNGVLDFSILVSAASPLAMTDFVL
jgi:serralysin